MPTLTDPTTRFHLSLNVNDLPKSVSFLTALFGCPPKRHLLDYAKFEPNDLPLVLSLEPRTSPQAPLQNTAGEGPLNHVGIRLSNVAQLVEVQRRLESAGYSTQREDGVECCYASQTKFWVQDNDRTMWEVYVLLADLDHRGGQHDGLQSHRHAVEDVLQPALLERRIWRHRLNEEFPNNIPHAGELSEVSLQGSWNARRHIGQWERQLERVRSALRPGGKLVVHLLTSNESIAELQPLAGPAVVVEVVPRLNDVLNALRDGGFVDVQLSKYGSSPCFTQNGVEMRESRLEAYSPPTESKLETLVRVVYKGPAARVEGDGGTMFDRGIPTLVPASFWERISQSPMSELFVKLADPSRRPLACGILPANDKV